MVIFGQTASRGFRFTRIGQGMIMSISFINYYYGLSAPRFKLVYVFNTKW